MTKDQTTGVIERAVYGLLMLVFMKLVAKGYMTADEAAYFATGIITAGAALYGWWINRPKAILQSASDLPEVKKIISTDSAQIHDPSLPKVQAQ